jgi:hypothetical protein
MRPSVVEVLDIGIKYSVELLLMQDEHVIKALSTHTSKKPFTDRIGPRSMVRRFEHLNACTGYLVRPFLKMRREQRFSIVLSYNFLKVYASNFEFLQ